jgi:predicted transcriptional regulator
MSERAGIEGLLFELASEDRLRILETLDKNALKMNDIAKKLDLTATENFRHIQRLTEANLIVKQPDTTYCLTQIGKLIMNMLLSLEVIDKHKDYFLNRDVWKLPYPFINRLGELSNAQLGMNTVENLNGAAQALTRAEKYVWGMGDRAMEYLEGVMTQAVAKGVKFRYIFPEAMLPHYKITREMAPYAEHRTLKEVCLVVFCSEKEAALCLPTMDGRLDYAGFNGSDPMFRLWTEDLFSYYWERGKRVIPQ